MYIYIYIAATLLEYVPTIVATVFSRLDARVVIRCRAYGTYRLHM